MELRRAFDEFVLAMRADGLSDATIQWHNYLAGRFVSQHPTMRMERVTATTVRRFIVAQRDRGLSTETITDYTNSVKRFFSWLSAEYNVPNPTQNIKKPRQHPRQPKGVAPDTAVNIFNAIPHDTVTGKRDRALVAFLIDSGCRNAGICTLTLENLKTKELRAEVTEKGSSWRVVYFSQFTADLLDEWLEHRPIPSPFVFYALRNGYNQLTRFTVRDILDRLANNAGVTGRHNAHAFRHAFAREFLQSGGDLSSLSRLMGHTTMETTASYYALFDDAELSNSQKRYSPIRKLETKKPPE